MDALELPPDTGAKPIKPLIAVVRSLTRPASSILSRSGLLTNCRPSLTERTRSTALPTIAGPLILRRSNVGSWLAAVEGKQLG
jgi:hypothetical protein